jgi:hypothetical protein
MRKWPSRLGIFAGLLLVVVAVLYVWMARQRHAGMQTFSRITPHMPEREVEAVFGDKGVEAHVGNLSEPGGWIAAFHGPWIWKEWRTGADRIVIAFDVEGNAVAANYVQSREPFWARAGRSLGWR